MWRKRNRYRTILVICHPKRKHSKKWLEICEALNCRSFSEKCSLPVCSQNITTTNSVIGRASQKYLIHLISFRVSPNMPEAILSFTYAKFSSAWTCSKWTESEKKVQFVQCSKLGTGRPQRGGRIGGLSIGLNSTEKFGNVFWKCSYKSDCLCGFWRFTYKGLPRTVNKALSGKWKLNDSTTTDISDQALFPLAVPDREICVR